MRLILMGPPGAGKGTLASLLKETLKVPHISTGDILREEMKKGSPLGKKAKGFIETGALVPDELVTALVEKRLATGKDLKKGFMLDGFPRTLAQAKDLDGILAKLKRPLDRAIYLESTLPVIIQRLTGRRVCRKCGTGFHVTNRPPKKAGVCDLCRGELYQRADDNEETIRKRMDVYLTTTLPIVDYYKGRGNLLTMDGDAESEDLERRILKALDEPGIHHK
jgi:adenylate kinase